MTIFALDGEKSPAMTPAPPVTRTTRATGPLAMMTLPLQGLYGHSKKKEIENSSMWIKFSLCIFSYSITDLYPHKLISYCITMSSILLLTL